MKKRQHNNDLLTGQRKKSKDEKSVDSGNQKQNQFEIALRESEEHYRALLNALPDAVIITDLNGKITDCNDAAVISIGLPRKDIIGESFPNLLTISKDDSPQYFDIINGLIKGQSIKPIEISVNLDDTMRWIEIYISLLKKTGKAYAIQIIWHDISEKKNGEKLRGIMTGMSQAIHKAKNLENLIEIIHKGLGALTDTTNFYVALYNESNETYSFPYFVDECNHYRTNISYKLESSLTDYVRRTGTAQLINLEKYDSLVKANEVKAGGISCKIWLGVPLMRGNRAIGVAALQSYHEEDLYSEKDLCMLTRVSEHITHAIERKCNEESLRTSEEKFRTIFNNANDIIVYLDRFGSIISVNRDIVFGYKQEDIIGKNFITLGFVSAKSTPRILKIFMDIISGKKSLSLFEVKIRDKENNIKFVEASSKLIKENGQVQGVLSIVRDISERKKREAVIKESEQFNRAVIEHSPIGLSIRSKTGQLISSNEAWRKIWNISSKQLNDYIKRDRHELRFDEKDKYLASWIPRVKRIYQEGGYLHIPELQLQSKKNIGRWISQHFYAIKNEIGLVDKVVILTEDITERKRADASLRENEEFNRAVIEYSPIGVSVRNRTGKLLSANEAWKKIWAMSDDSLHDSMSRERKILQFDERDNYLGEWKSKVEKIYKKGGYLYIPELRLRKPHETNRWVSQHFYAIKDDKNNVERVVILTEDITQNKRVTEALKVSEERFRTVFETAQDAIFIKDRQHRYTQVNTAMANLLGVTRENIIGKNNKEVWGEEDSKIILEVDKRVLSGEVVEEISTKTIDGTPHVFHVVEVPMKGPNGEITGLCGIAREITDQRKIEEELARAEKLESVGLLASGIAHDFNNILTSILGNISLAKMDINLKSEAYSLLSDAELASSRAQNLTQQLLTFSMGGAPVKRTAPINNLLIDLANFALRGSNVKCEFDLTDNLHAVDIDIGQMSQVINNLIINADQVMPSGGIINIGAKNIVVNKDVSVPLNNGKYVIITITDQGGGIPEEYLSKIFDPYFTTKEKGSGLGLATTYSIIRNHEGYINVTSKPGVGATFDIYLPASKRELTPPRKKRPRLVRGKNLGHILIMDDDEMILKVAGVLLSRLGFYTEFAKDGREAIKLYKRARRRGKPFDIVIMDLTIPGGMGGQEAIKKLKKIDPNIRAIVSSGYSNDPVMANYEDYGFEGVAVKPYSIKELAEIIKEALA